MRDGFAASVFGHAVLLAWGLISFQSPTPLDAGSIESIPIDFISDAPTVEPKGVKTAAVAPKPEPEPVAKKAEPPPEPAPPPPEPTPPPPEPTPPPPEPAPPEPAPPEPTPPPPEPAPPQAAQAEPPPPAPPQPEPPPPPTPEPPPPTPAPAPQAPTPPPEPSPPPPPAPETATIQPKPDKVPLPKLRPKVQPPVPPAPQVAKKDPGKFDPDQITALLDKDKQQQPPQAQPPANQPATQGVATASLDAKMSASELDALRARLISCWNVPVGWTDPAEIRVTVVINLNPDGSLNGSPTVKEQPQGRYAQVAVDSALRAVRRCAPYDFFPREKYDTWKQVQVRFDPKEMGGA